MVAADSTVRFDGYFNVLPAHLFDFAGLDVVLDVTGEGDVLVEVILARIGYSWERLAGARLTLAAGVPARLRLPRGVFDGVAFVRVVAKTDAVIATADYRVLAAPLVEASITLAITGSANTSGATMGLQVADPTKLQASSFEIAFTGTTAGSVTRHSDNKVFVFANLGDLTTIMANNGLAINDGGAPPGAFAGAAAGDRFLANPMAGAAAEFKALQYSPVDLAAANPVNAAMRAANGGTLQLASLKATGPITQPTTGSPVTIAFTAGSPATYSATVPGPPIATIATGNYVSGETIAINGWEITLQGAPKSGDTVTVGNATDAQYGDWYKRDAGNARALMDLRDVQMFDGATLSDGFASAMAQVGTRTQSAQYAAELSSAIAANLERDRTAVSGVNLDEEAARLIQFQQAYQASAKMLQIAQNIFDTLIQGLGR